MSLLNRVGRLAGRIGTVLQERVGDFVEDTLLPETVKQRLTQVEQAIAHGKIERALELLDEVEASKPGVLRVRVLRGVAYLEMGRMTRAVHFLESALQQRESAEIYHFLALAYEQQQRLGDARNALLAALRSDREPTLEFDLLLALGRIYMSMGRADKATRELQRALKVRPADEAALTLLAAALRAQNQTTEAIAVLVEHRDQLLHTASWILLGQLQLEHGEFEAAASHFEEALNRDPGSVDALDGAAAAALAVEDFERLEVLLEQARERDVRSVRLMVVEGRLALVRGDLDVASERFDAVLELAPGQLEALVGAGEVAIRQGDASRADHLFGRALADREHEPALLGAAQARLALGDRAGALRLLQRVRARDESVEALRLQGELARTAGANLEAIVYYQEAARRAPERQALEATLVELLWEVSPRLKWPRDPRAAAQLHASLEALGEHARREPLLAKTLGEINAAIAAFESPLRVAIMGEFNAGKSTLINALLGEDVVPTGILPTTAHLNVVRYGSRRVARILLRGDEPPREVAYSEVRAQIEALGERIDHFEFLYPHPQLRIVHFIDTPGFNAAEETHGEIAAQALGSADAILWLFDSNQALSDSQRQILASVDGGAEKIFVLLNKVDNLTDDDEAELLTYLEQNLSGRVHRILPLSALRALQARQAAQREEREPDAEQLREARWEAFSQALEADLIERTTALKTAELWRHLHAIADRVHEMAGAAERRLTLLHEQMQSGREALERARDRFLSRELPEAVDRLRRQQDVALTSVAREADDARRPSGGWLSPLTLDADDLTFLLDLLRDRLDQALTRSQTQVEQRITEPVEAAMQTLEWIARALEPSQAQALFARLERFVAEEHLTRQRLASMVYERERANLLGRLSTANALDPLAPRKLGATEATEADRKQWLATLVGDPAARVGATLAGWVEEYFDTVMRLCDNVRRDIELMQLELRYRVRAPFEFETS